MGILGSAVKASLASVLVFVLAVVYDKHLNTARHGHPHAGLEVDKLLIEYGYPVEIHEITTEDGYILRAHRIPHGKLGKEENITRPPVLLAHCLACAGVDYVTAGPNKALSTLLSDAGYDVWLFNSRGTTWSKRHKSLDSSDPKFWNYTWHEIGLYDLPKTIDHILDVTGYEKIYYVGMSQGTTSFFVMLSEKPEYNDKIQFMVGLAPAVIIDPPQGPVLRFLVQIRNYYWLTREYFGFNEYFPTGGFSSRYLKVFCDPGSLFSYICIFANSMLIGFNEKEITWEQIPVIFAVTPAGCSSKQIEHFLQIIAFNNFTKFDYGRDKNLELYKQESPPQYVLSNARVPVSLYYSEGDWIINPRGVERLLNYLPNLVKSVVVSDKEFNHNDFLYALHVRELVYFSVLEDIRNH